jgi:hypothetical protein
MMHPGSSPGKSLSPRSVSSKKIICQFLQVVKHEDSAICEISIYDHKDTETIFRYMPHTHNLIPEAPQVGKTNLYLKW